jgi:porphobilinogen synthase
VTAAFPTARGRRLRAGRALRRLVAQTRPAPADLVLPLFVKEGAVEPVPVSSMPGIVQHCPDSLRRALDGAVRAGIGGVMLFGVPTRRDATGSGACDPRGVLTTAVGEAAEQVGGDLVVMADLCLDEFTDHGHCGVLDEHGAVDNDATLEHYRRMAVALADAGAQVVAPSGMMDGQVAAVRGALDGYGRQDVAILAYAAKYASAFYGPFRDAVESTLDGDRKSYQMDPANRTEALREVDLDIAEGADMVMVKPALSYLDVVSDVAARAAVPVAAYQVSGEYSMIEAAAQRGWVDRERAVLESLISIRRAGAGTVLTYWATEAAQWLT